MRPGDMPDDAETLEDAGAHFEGFVRTVIKVVHDIQGDQLCEGAVVKGADLSILESEALISSVVEEVADRLTPEQAFAFRHPEARRIDQMNGDALFAAISASAKQAAEVTKSKGRAPVYKIED